MGGRFSIVRLLIMSCMAWVCASGAKAYAGNYSACGVLVEIQIEGGCLVFTPDDGSFPNGLLLGGGFPPGLRGHVRVSGTLFLDCVSICQIGEEGCLSDVTIESCIAPDGTLPAGTIPAVSDWGMGVLILLLGVGITLLVRNGIRRSQTSIPDGR